MEDIVEPDENLEEHDLYLRSSREILEECLKESFSANSIDDSLYPIIRKVNPYLYSKVSDIRDIDKLFTALIDHCTEKNDFDNLWLGIKEHRPKRYEEFFSKWKKSYNEEKQKKQQYNIGKQKKSTEKETDVSDWFFDTLEYCEQSMVITAALFQGVDIDTFNELNKKVHNLIFPDVKEKQEHVIFFDEFGEDSDPRLKNEQEIFIKTRLKFDIGKRNSHYGLTDVQVVIFEFEEYQMEIIEIIKNKLFSLKVDLLSFIASLGENKNAEKRFFAVNAVLVLSETILFQDVLKHIIGKWANTKNYLTHQATANALSGILFQKRQTEEILALLNSWLKISNNTFLNITSISTYYLVADQYPQEALHAIEIASNKENLLVKSGDIAFRVYRNNKLLFIQHLHIWLVQEDRPMLRQQAAHYFFRFINIDDAVQNREKIVAILSILWKNRKIPMRQEMQENTKKKVKAWAEEALSVLEHGKKESFSEYQELFYLLYHECNEKLGYYLPKWQEYKEYNQERASNRIGNDNLKKYDVREEEVNFLILIPKGE